MKSQKSFLLSIALLITISIPTTTIPGLAFSETYKDLKESVPSLWNLFSKKQPTKKTSTLPKVTSNKKTTKKPNNKIVKAKVSVTKTGVHATTTINPKATMSMFGGGAQLLSTVLQKSLHFTGNQIKKHPNITCVMLGCCAARTGLTYWQEHNREIQKQNVNINKDLANLIKESKAKKITTKIDCICRLRQRHSLLNPLYNKLGLILSIPMWITGFNFYTERLDSINKLEEQLIGTSYNDIAETAKKIQKSLSGTS